MVTHEVMVGRVAVDDVATESPAATAGIEPGDTILEINGDPMRSITDIHRSIQLNLGNEIVVLVQHGDLSTEEFHVVPRWKPPEGQGAIGVQVSLEDVAVVEQSYPFWQAIPMGAANFADIFVLYANGIASMFIGATPADVTGPVGIIQVTGEVARTGIGPLLEFAALISLILGVINLFPIPAVDGGRIAFVLLEVVRRGRRVSPRTEGLVHSIGFAVLIAIFIVITYRDIARIASGGSLFP